LQKTPGPVLMSKTEIPRKTAPCRRNRALRKNLTRWTLARVGKAKNGRPITTKRANAVPNGVC